MPPRPRLIDPKSSSPVRDPIGRRRGYNPPSGITPVPTLVYVVLLVGFITTLSRPSIAAPLDASTDKGFIGALFRHTRSSEKSCQMTSSEIALPLTFTIEMPSYVMIGNHKFNLKLQMPLVAKP